MDAATAQKSAQPEVSLRDMANAIRALSMDAVEKAASGHPGMPMGMADVATVLFTQFLKFDPQHPQLAGPRSLHPVGRPRLDAALFAAASDRLCRHDAGPAEELPPARQQDRRPSGIRPRRRDRDHHRSARPGPRQLGRLRAGGAHPERALRRRPGQPLHLCAGGRRLPDGRPQPGGDLPRRPS